MEGAQEIITLLLRVSAAKICEPSLFPAQQAFLTYISKSNSLIMQRFLWQELINCICILAVMSIFF